MTARVELPDRDILVRIFDDGTAIMVDVEVVGGTKDGDDRGKLFGRRFAVHHVSGVWLAREWDTGGDGTYPASWASCPRTIPSRLFRSRNLHAASYLCIVPHFCSSRKDLLEE